MWSTPGGIGRRVRPFLDSDRAEFLQCLFSIVSPELVSPELPDSKGAEEFHHLFSIAFPEFQACVPRIPSVTS